MSRLHAATEWCHVTSLLKNSNKIKLLIFFIIMTSFTSFTSTTRMRFFFSRGQGWRKPREISLSHPPNEVWNEEGATGSLRTSMRGESEGTKWLRLFWIKQLRCTGHTLALSLSHSLSRSLSLRLSLLGSRCKVNRRISEPDSIFESGFSLFCCCCCEAAAIYLRFMFCLTSPGRNHVMLVRIH